jgi:acyl-[acyl-carrier-protein]-phospholipid O-acyltransferase / long-chain-fatty-acid--[acyl-carrier-protein] ligase
VTGAEKLKPRVADAFEERFGIRPLEGYGATELSPVCALSVPDVEVDGVRQAGHKPGSVGHPIPGVCVKTVDPQTGAVLPEGESGLLLVKGPNVMSGYLNDPARSAEVIQDGWYVTGDVARVDEDGFVFLLDRLSRYSKIAGEMVPHMAVEEKLTDAIGAMQQVVVVTSVEDEKKGEQLVVLCTPEAGELDALSRLASDSDLPNLWKPRRENFLRIDAFPTLGSGKVDLKRIREMARELVAGREGGGRE